MNLTVHSDGRACSVCMAEQAIRPAYYLAWTDDGRQVVVNVCAQCQPLYFATPHAERTIVAKTPAKPPEVIDIEAEASDSLALVKDFPIASQEDLTFAEDILQDVKGKLKRLEAIKRKITDPLNEALKEARALFAPAERHFKEIEYILKKAIASFEADQATARKAAVQALAEAPTAQAGVQALAQLQASTVEHSKGVTTRKVWKFEVVSEDAVPDEYKYTVVDKQRLADAVATGVRDIPGVRIYEDTIVAAKAR